MHLQSNLRFLLAFKNLTYPQFAEAIGCTAGMLKTYALKGAQPPLAILCNIADFAGVSLDVLIREELTEENYSQLHRPPVTPSHVKELQGQIDELSNRMARLEKAAAKGKNGTIRSNEIINTAPKRRSKTTLRKH